MREAWLHAHPLCGDRAEVPSQEHSACLRAGKATQGSEVDHIIPHKGDQDLFWDADNLQTLCRSCHSTKTASEDGGFGRRAA